MTLDHESNAHTRRIRLLAGLGEEDQITIEPRPGAFQEEERHQIGGEVVFVVARAEASDVSRSNELLGWQRRLLPRLIYKRRIVSIRSNQGGPPTENR